MSAVLDRYERQATLLDTPGRSEAEKWADIDELIRREAPWQKPREVRARYGDPDRAAELMNLGGPWYQDTRAPHPAADFSTVTLSTTSLQLWPSSVWTPTFATDWWAGKLFYLRCFGKITTAATPGNLTIELRYGTADNAGTILATSAAQTLVASQTNISWRCEFRIRCTATGPTTTSGALKATGVFECNTAVIAAGQAIIPATAPATVASLDLTSTQALNLQFKRSGSTAEVATVTDLELVAQN